MLAALARTRRDVRRGAARDPAAPWPSLRRGGGGAGQRFMDLAVDHVLLNLSHVTRIDVDGIEALQVCAPDEDWYVIQADAGCTVFVHIDFVHADGDLDLAIMDASQMLLDVSDGVTDSEDVTLAAVETGPLYINVFGFRGDANSYSMQVNEACP